MSRQRTESVREGKNLDAALRKAKKEIAQRKKLSESRERQERKERSGTGRKPERRCEREAEWTSVPKRGNRNHDGGHADVPQPEEQVRENKAQNRPPPAPKKVSTAPSPPQRKSQHSPVPSMSCRLDGPFSPHDYYPSTEQPRQRPPQTPRSPSRSGTSQAPVELPATPPRRALEQAEKKPKETTAQQVSRPPPPTVLPATSPRHVRESSEKKPKPPTVQQVSKPTPPTGPPATPPRRAREPAEKKPKPPTAQQVPKPHEGTPSTSTASRHVPAPSKNIRFRSPPHSGSPPTVLHISRPSKALPGAFPSSEE